MISDKTHKLFEEIAEYIIKLYKRAEKSEAMVERMIEAGERLCKFAEELDDLVGDLADGFHAYPDIFSWRVLVSEWKERE